MIYANQGKLKVHIRDAVRGGLYECPRCKDSVVCVQAGMQPWHFRHKKKSDCVGPMQKNSIGCVSELTLKKIDKCLAKDECQEECEYRI